MLRFKSVLIKWFALNIKYIEIRIFVVIAILLIATASIITLNLKKDTENNFQKVQQESASNLLETLYGTIKNEYQNIINHKQIALEFRKKELKEITQLGISVTHAFYHQYQYGLLSEQEAKRQAMEAIKNMRYDHDIGYLWINNMDLNDPKLIMHPIMLELVGKKIKGIRKNIFRAFIDLSLKKDEGYLNYRWPKPTNTGGITQEQPKISYVAHFQPWNWVIGSGLYIDDLEKKHQKRLRSFLKKIRQSFKKMKLANYGYPFIINSDQLILAHPYFTKTYMGNIINPATGFSLFQNLKKASQNAGKPYRYLWSKTPVDTQNFTYEKQAYVKYFKPLKWYIAVSFYLEDVNKPVNKLTGQIFLLSLLLLLIFLIGTFIFLIIIKKQHLAEQQLNDVVNAASEVSIVAIDPLGIITLFNSGAERMLGYTKEEVVGKHTPELFHKNEEIIARREELSKQYQEDLSGMRFFTKETDLTGSEKREWNYIKKDGTEINISLIVTAIKDQHQKIKGYVGISRDITQQKIVEQKLRESQKLEAIGQLAGGVAHDFNNMLAGIMGAAELLKSPKRTLDPKNLQYVEMIIKTTTRAGELTSKLLAFARRGKITSKTIDIHDIVYDTITLLERTVDKRITITTELYASSQLVKGDPATLQNAILNLGINAAHAMPSGGDILIKTGNVIIDQNNHIKISIQDTGCGIPPQNIDKIFEPFYTTRKQEKGTGLGLSTVYGTIQEHNGSIELESKIDHGSCFHIYLPCTTKFPQKLIKHQMSMTGSGRILLVDDEQVIQETGTYLLKDMGYDVIIAQNGAEAVEIFKKEQKNIVLVMMDMIMPIMNGREAFLKIREIDPQAKVVISSGFIKNENLNEMLQQGLMGFIQKPFQTKKLSQLLTDILSNNKD